MTCGFISCRLRTASQTSLLRVVCVTFLILGLGAASSAAAAGQADKVLHVYFVDVEGGQATLFVTPAGQSLLIDTGWAGGRDADRIVGVAKQAGLSQIDYLVTTHYHGDHVGGLADLAAKFPIK